MIIYLDENIAPTLALGFHQLQFLQSQKKGLTIYVRALENDFGKGCKDEAWIPIVGQNDNCVITQDINIQRTKAQWQLCQQNNVGIFFIKSSAKKGYSYWDMVKLLVNKWEEMVEIIRKQPKPFAYKISMKGKFEKLL
ncbi:MAG TPA: hypothetical protein VFG10_00535 [Saprospiraceae bacterium]|nr:hypothetical protein [Saprospiraceae bacterium]